MNQFSMDLHIVYNLKELKSIPKKLHEIVYLVFGIVNTNIGTKYQQPYYCKIVNVNFKTNCQQLSFSSTIPS